MVRCTNITSVDYFDVCVTNSNANHWEKRCMVLSVVLHVKKYTVLGYSN